MERSVNKKRACGRPANVSLGSGSPGGRTELPGGTER